MHVNRFDLSRCLLFFAASGRIDVLRASLYFIAESSDIGTVIDTCIHMGCFRIVFIIVDTRRQLKRRKFLYYSSIKLFY